MKIKSIEYVENGEFRIPKKGEYYFEYNIRGDYIIQQAKGGEMIPQKIAVVSSYSNSDWRPTGGEQFWTIDITVKKDKHDNTQADFDRIDTGNCFFSKKEAEKMVEKLKIRLQKGLEG